MKNSRILSIGGAILAITFCYSGFKYLQLPNRVPVHFNAAGEVDRYGSKLEAVGLMPVIMLLLFALFLWIPGRLPKEQNTPMFRKVWEPMTLGILGFEAVVQFIILNPGLLGTGPGQVKVLMVAMSLLFVILGNLMGKTERNYVMGIRTPWTLASDEVWHKTHRLAGHWMVGGGLISMVLAILGVNVLLITGLIIATTLYPVWHSYRLYRKLESQ